MGMKRERRAIPTVASSMLARCALWSCVHAGVLSSMAEDRLRGPKFSISHSHTKNLKSKNKQVNSQSREKEWAEILTTEGICALLKALALGPAERADLSVVPWERISEHR